MFVKEQKFCFRGISRHFSSCGGQGPGFRGSVSSIQSQQLDNYMFARPLATIKSILDQRERDLARREFQLRSRETKLLKATKLSKATLSPEEKLLWRLKKVLSWRGENMFGKEQKFCFQGISRHLSSWGGQGPGFRGSVSSIQAQQWNNYMFARPLATLKGKLDRRKRDLARREFQLLRRKTKLLKATLSPEEKLLWRLKKANRKKALLLQRLKKYELEEDPEPVHDPELITAEQLHALKKIGYKNRNYVPVGRRGVFGGVVLNMHMHWKFHETVQVDCHIYKREDIRSIAKQLAILSGGIVIDIHQATNIIMYRGRNYKQPKQQMTPPNTLTKRKALFKSKFLQALDSLEETIKDIEGQLQIVRRKQKQSAEQGTETGTCKPHHIASNQVEDEELLAGLSEVPSDDLVDDDDGLFSWETESLDEDEFSDDDGPKHKEKAKEVQEKATKPISCTSVDSAAQVGKKKRPTAKELILLEQELFENRRRADKAKELVLAEQELFKNRRQADSAQKDRLTSVQSHTSIDCKSAGQVESSKTDDRDAYFEKGAGFEDSNPHGLWSSEDDGGEDDANLGTWKGHEQTKNRKKAQSLEGFITDSDEEKEEHDSDLVGLVKGSQGKACARIKNKKIAQFMEGFMTDSEVDEQLDSDFDDLDECKLDKASSFVKADSTSTQQKNVEK